MMFAPPLLPLQVHFCVDEGADTCSDCGIKLLLGDYAIPI